MARSSRLEPRSDWVELPDQQLLDRTIASLGLTLEGSMVEPLLGRLDEELARRGLRFRPYTWLSTDWFTPDDATGFAIPFYLAHPRLVSLERRQMLEVEGGTKDECLKILRHETAHALDNAYRLRRKKLWRETFGSASDPYDSSYTPDPTSRSHVLNLDHWYSQSHPLEDWAETFAVWLQPGARWRKRYAGWPALRKLEAVDELVRGIAEDAPAMRTRHKEDPVHRLTTTLRELYDRKKAFYAEESNPAFDGQLARVFPPPAEAAGRPRAAAFLRAKRRDLIKRVATATGQHRYLLDHVVREMIACCKQKDLRLAAAQSEAIVDAAVVLTSLSSQFLYGAHPRYQR
ncbi:MAG: hypothetical protein KDC14_09875 [Planctomycetes bacterium]|nr:hypothetical protein [Planctomycetota bacterium]